MTMMILGLIIFLGAHTFVTLRGPRAAVIGRIGEGAYKGAFSIVALAGFVLIAWGFARYRADGMIPVWDPPRGMNHAVILLMWFAFVMLAAAYSPAGRIKGWLRHPMLNAVKTWAFAHLLANGDLGSIILFGSILIWGGYDRFALKWRGDMGAPRLAHFTKGDVIALAAGSIGWLAMIFLHPYLIGVPVIGT